ncbi:hypothetical protein V5N11_003803 [Cardamine amara subsp. amara]|uniref:Uncharacterized protein n=1 Tax=Cardamine amara subsp. amara TaxID=228776 RepID=A0ABD0ZBC2_CARAN
MMISMEALAMAGADFQEWGLSIEEWELQESVVPPHLLAYDSEEEEEDSKVEEDHRYEDEDEDDYHQDDDGDRVFNVLAVKQTVTCDIRASVGKLIEQSIAHIFVHLKHIKFLTLLLENFLLSHVLYFLL